MALPNPNLPVSRVQSAAARTRNCYHQRNAYRASATIAFLALCLTVGRSQPSVPVKPAVMPRPALHKTVTASVATNKTGLKVSTFALVSQPSTTNASLGWLPLSTEGYYDGLVLLGGRYPGSREIEVYLPYATTDAGGVMNPANAICTISNLVPSSAYWFRLSAYSSNWFFTTNCIRGKCTTNTYFEATPSTETMFYTASLKPTLVMSNKLPSLFVYGTAGRSYSVRSGASLWQLAMLTNFTGSNALWAYQEAALPANYFVVGQTPIASPVK